MEKYFMIGGTIILVLIILMIVFYNKLIVLRTKVEESWSDIGIQLKFRLDLIPNLVNTVKGFAKHEEKVFTQVTEARANLSKAQGVAQTAEAENKMQGVLKTLFAVAENYPELKADAGFLKLQQQLEDTEHKIQASRRFYNASVKEFNTQVMLFPTNLIAGMFGFVKKDFFEIADRESAENAPEVNFDK